MTDWAMHSFSQESQILPKRLGEFLKRRGSAKEQARQLEIDLRTINNLRAGVTWPIARHWWNIWVEFGDDALEAVFHPELAEARLKREAEQREAARQQRIASASLALNAQRASTGDSQALGSDDEPLGPPNLDLFEGGV